MSQYLRTITATIATGPTFTWDGTRPAGQEGIRVRFETHQRDSSTPNYAEIRVTEQTAQPAFFENRQVTLTAGYGEAAGLIFQDQIRQARTQRENVTDRVLHILASDMGVARNTAMVNQTLKAGHTFRDRVDVCFAALGRFGVKPGYIAGLPNTKFPRAYAMHGMAKDLLRDICTATNTAWSIQNGTAQLLANGQPRPGNAIVLNSRTGLIQTIMGIEGTCLLNPGMVPGGLVRIDQRSIQRSAISPAYGASASNGLLQQVSIAADGLYKLFLVEHRGDARGNDFYTGFIGVKLGDKTPAALASRGIHNPDLQITSPNVGATTGGGAAASGAGDGRIGDALGAGSGTL